MASLRKDKRTGKWFVQFRFDRPRQYTKSTGTANKQQAETKLREIEETIYLLREGLISIPADENVADWIYTRGKTAGRKKQLKSDNEDVCSAVLSWLQYRQLLVSADQLSMASYDSDHQRIAKFAQFCGEDAPISKLTDTLDRYHKHCMKRLSSGVSPTTVRHELRTIAAATRWLWSRGKIDSLPRGLDTYAKVRIPDPTPEIFSVDEILRLWDEAPGKTRLYILLGLNCGYTQSDIASLQKSMVDFDTGIVDRGRHKTEQPQVHKLWPSTLRLLQRYIEEDGSLVLLGRNGHPLLHRSVRNEGRPYKTDAIGLAFSRIMKDGKIDVGRSFSSLRNTGASALDSQYQEYPHLVDMYLGHRETKMRKHYTDRHYDLLNEATDWLGRHFGLFT